MARQTAAVIIVCGLLAVFVAPARAQERSLRLGVVDMAKVLDEYQEFQASDAQYRAFLREREMQLTERTGLRLLTAEELKEFYNLKAVAAPTDEQKRRIEQLRAVAEARENELRGLQAVTAPAEEEKRRLAELQELAQNSNAEIQQLRERLSAEINQRNKELSESLNQKIETALAAVAKAKHLDFVLAKNVVLYGGLDITADVLTRLNAGS